MTKTILIVSSLAVVILATCFIAGYGIGSIAAASIADNIVTQTGANSNGSGAIASAGTGSGSFSSSSSSSSNGGQGITLTASADRGEIRAGSTQVIHIRALTNNGTAIADLPVQVLVKDYATGNQKLLLAGQTNERGETDVRAPISSNSSTGQYFVVISAEKGGDKSTISTGFAVDEKGSSSSSSSSSSGKCSGSSCR